MRHSRQFRSNIFAVRLVNVVADRQYHVAGTFPLVSAYSGTSTHFVSLSTGGLKCPASGIGYCLRQIYLVFAPQIIY